jgi:multicomponent Na+:H+ antiporter subunit E
MNVRRIPGLVAAYVALVLVYLLTLGSRDPLDVAAGVVFAIAAMLLARPVLVRTNDPEAVAALPSFGRRLAAAPGFIVSAAYEITRSALIVMAFSLGIKPLVRPGIVGVPIGDRTPTGIAVSAMVTTLSPGATLVDVDHERGVMWLHVLDATDPDEVRAAHQRFYQRHQRKIFP